MDTRGRILREALAAFHDRGYSGVSVRAVARAAGVDHALVHYYFRTKEGLFRAAMDLNATPGQVIQALAVQGRSQRLGTAVLQQAVTMWERPDAQAGLVGMVGEALTDETVMDVVRDYLEIAVIAQLAETVGGREATRRAAAAGAIISGVYFSRYVLHVEPLASMSPAEVVAALGPSVDAALQPPRGATVR